MSAADGPRVPGILRVGALSLALGLVSGLIGCGGGVEHAKKDGAIHPDRKSEQRESDRSRLDRGMSKDEKKDEKRDGGRDEKKKDGPPDRNTEEYTRIVDNPYQLVKQTPRSTFSIDVDTASYSNVRRFLTESNQLPPADAVRIEEMVNYFPYDYPQPKGTDPVGFTLDVADCPWNARHHLVRIAMRGQVLDAEDLPARNFVFLIDTSGSMSPANRLPLLKSTLSLLVEGLHNRDRVAIVAYAGSAGLVLPSTPGDEKQTILRALDKLHSGGSTAGGAGIQLAYKIARENFIKGGLNRVILGTDGDFNVGVSSTGELTRMVEEERKSGVFLTILGFGMGNLKDARMEQLAHHGNGHYAYIDTLAEARKVFVEQGGALVTIAKDVKLQVEFNPLRVQAYRLVGYENRLLRDQDFKDDKKDAGDLGSGHTVTALYEIVPPGVKIEVPGVDPLKYQTQPEPGAGAQTGEWLTVKMRYKDPDAETSKELSQPLSGGVVKLKDAPADFRFAAAVAGFGMVLRKSDYRGEATYVSIRDLATGALGGDPGGHRAEFLKLVEKARELDKR